MSITRKNQNHDVFCWGALGAAPISCGGSMKSSSTFTRFGLRAVGLSACNTISGTMTVRLQYEILSRWNGNQRGSSMISTGSIGVARQEMNPNNASIKRVNTLARE